MGVVYHAHYLVWCDIGRTEYIRRLGISYAEIETAGLLLAVADVGVRYGAPARYDDLISVETRLTEVRSRSLRFDYVICRETEPRERLATAFVRLVPMNRDGVPRRLPADLLNMFRDALSS
jgi:acyl-CoA thioester hydrolase